MQTEPQLSAEMEKRLSNLLFEELVTGLLDSKYRVFRPNIYDKLKHFLATALEEQKQDVLAEIEGVTGAKSVQELLPTMGEAYKDISVQVAYKEGYNKSKSELRAKLVEMKGENV